MKSFDIPGHFKSDIIGKVKAMRRVSDPRKKDFTPTILDFGSIRIILARHFGFCYGVENAIERAYRAIREQPGKNIYLLSEMIHNPNVNKDLQENGIRFIMDTYGKQIIPWSQVTPQDIVMIPAFGTTLEIEAILQEKGIDIVTYNTTCPFVEKVWNRSEKLSENQFTVIIHGKPGHEETRATFSHAASHSPALVVKNIEECRTIAELFLANRPAAEFMNLFGERVSRGFSWPDDLNRVGVVNQTTMLAEETQEIADFFKNLMIEKFGEGSLTQHFADNRDTLCYATNDNQQATYALLEQEADLALVVGGYNSSNTSHIADLCEKKFPTFFIEGAHEIVSKEFINHFLYHKKEKVKSRFIPKKEPVTIVLTSGASCPDTVLDEVLKKVISFFPEAISVEAGLKNLVMN